MLPPTGAPRGRREAGNLREIRHEMQRGLVLAAGREEIRGLAEDTDGSLLLAMADVHLPAPGPPRRGCAAAVHP